MQTRIEPCTGRLNSSITDSAWMFFLVPTGSGEEGSALLFSALLCSSLLRSKPPRSMQYTVHSTPTHVHDSIPLHFPRPFHHVYVMRESKASPSYHNHSHGQGSRGPQSTGQAGPHLQFLKLLSLSLSLFFLSISPFSSVRFFERKADLILSLFAFCP
jgi:hypothetical protein